MGGDTEEQNNEIDQNNNGGSNEVNQETPTAPPDSDGDGVPDRRDDYPNDSSRSRQIESISDTRNIEEDDWRYYTFNFSSTGTVEYEFVVREGPPIDAIFMEESEYEYFEEGERAQYYQDLTIMDSTGGSTKGQVSEGTYYMVFDNSNLGEAAPPANLSNDVVSVDFTLEASE